MKRNNTKKGISIGLCLVVLLAMFTGCTPTKKGTLSVGLIQLVEHTSLIEIQQAFEGELTALAQASGLEIELTVKNAQGDSAMIQTIARGYVSDKVDVIVAIATPSAQGAASVTTDIPIVFSAVTDSVAAGLLTNPEAPEGNITGISDAIAVDKIFTLAEELTPNIKQYGLLYNNSEINSVSVIKDVKAHLTTIGIPFSEITVSSSGDVLQSTQVLLETCDALFVPIDNTVARVMPAVAEAAIEKNVPVYVAADSMVTDGGLATAGVNYTELGKKTAAVTMQVLQGTAISDIPVQVMTDVSPVVNEKTAAAIGVDVSKYTN